MNEESVKAVKAQIEDMRYDTLKLFEKIFEKITLFGLPKPPSVVEQFKEKLSSDQYNVLVVGEAKRGKSSFVNALIGRTILPTDVDIATNQVFRVTNTPQEAYRLRFDDGSFQNITVEELQEYGSQTIADQKQIVHINLERLDYIEVNLPVRFLPAGVSILDTPGMGALYATHALITQRFVPQADAVIYVLDSNQPVTQFELDFITSILEVTNYIFFVQTKIDLYDKIDWQRVQQRNQDILQERFKERLPYVQVWPISSANLLKAATSNSQALLKVSRQKELQNALEVFLFKVAGWNRCVAALQVAERCSTDTKQLLVRDEAILREQAEQDVSSLHQEAVQRNKNLEMEWGENGKKKREMVKSVKRITIDSRMRMMHFLNTGGSLETRWHQTIDKVQSFEEANKLGNDLSKEVTTEAINTWREICEQARSQCTSLMGMVVEETSAFLISSGTLELPTYGASPPAPAPDLESDIGTNLLKAQDGFVLGGAIGFILVSAVPFLWPLAPIALGVGGILGAFGFWKSSEEKQLEEALDTLHGYLSNILHNVRLYYSQPNIEYDGKSLVYGYFDLLDQTMEAQIEEYVAGKLEETSRESTLLEEQNRLNKKQREEKLENLHQQLTEWDKDIVSKIVSVKKSVKTLERSLTELFDQQ